MRTIAIVNQKGGCGKTTTAINLASLYAKRGLRTLLVDFDPQAHCAIGLGVPEDRIEYSIADAILDDLSGRFNPERLTWEVSRNLDLAPSNMMLAAVESPGGGLHRLPDRDRRLALLLERLQDRYDRCLIDCPPTIGLLTFNALRAAREALIPVETGYFALRGAHKQWKTIQRLIARIDRPIACHLLPTLHDTESALARSILSRLKRDFAGQIMPVVIREHEVLREAASFGQPVLEYAPDSEAQRDFESLADWLEEHIAKPAAMEINVVRSGGLNMPSRIEAGLSSTPSLSASRTDLASMALGAAPVDAATRMVSAPVSPEGRASELARRVHQMRQRPATVSAASTTSHAQPASPPPAAILPEERGRHAPPRTEHAGGRQPHAVTPSTTRRAVEIEPPERPSEDELNLPDDDFVAPEQVAAAEGSARESSHPANAPQGEARRVDAAPKVEPSQMAAPAALHTLAKASRTLPSLPRVGIAEAVHDRIARPDHASAPAVKAVSIRPATTSSLVVAPHALTVPADEIEAQRKRLAPLFGVRQTAHGLMFMQPARAESKICIVGDFNEWSSARTPLKVDSSHGVAYTTVKLPPGQYQYRLIIDGAWQADPYNQRRQVNRYGELNSVVTVTEHAAGVPGQEKTV